VAWRSILYSLPMLLCCALLAGCRSAPPSISFVTIPPAGRGGKLQTADIAGKVTGAKKGQHILIFAKTDVWWFQSGDQLSYAEIQRDGSWWKSIHLGRQYAAILVDAAYRPTPTMAKLPEAGGDVLAIAMVPGTGAAPEEIAPAKPPVISFSGYHWNVRTVDGEHGGRSYPYDPANARVDHDGVLHMRITRHEKTWTCSEVELMRSLGYGTYRLQVKQTASLEPAAELSFFTWGEIGSDSDHHEIDINLSQKGDPRSKNAEYAVQPYYLPMNMSGFSAPTGVVTYTFDWEPEGISFSSWKGAGDRTASNRIWEHTFLSNIPVPGGETAHINLCIFGFPKVPLQHEVEFLIQRFEYLP
jgi:hypothetical protein